MTPRVARFLRADGTIPGIGPRTQLSAIKMRNTSWQGGSLVSLLFVDNEPTPRYVLRVPRDPARTERLSANYAALEALTQVPAVEGSVPAPIFAGEVEGVLMTIETFLDGRSLAMEMALADREGDELRFAALLSLACGWLWRLHDATWSAPEPGLLAAVLADADLLEQKAFLTAAEAASVRARLTALESLPLAVARRHGDFNPNNLLLPPAPDTLAAIDWEHSTPGLALSDLFHLVTIAYLFPAASPETRRARLESLWTPANPIGDAFLTALGRYAARLRVEVTVLRPCSAAYFVRMAADLLRFLGDRPEPMRAFWHDLLCIEN